MLDQENQSIEANKYEHPTNTLAMTFHKPAGGETFFVWFVYVSHIICNHNQGQVLRSMNAYLVNAN